MNHISLQETLPRKEKNPPTSVGGEVNDSLSYTELSDSGVLTVSISGLRAESANPVIELDLGD